jgi:hypothetical protein
VASANTGFRFYFKKRVLTAAAAIALSKSTPEGKASSTNKCDLPLRCYLKVLKSFAFIGSATRLRFKEDTHS